MRRRDEALPCADGVSNLATSLEQWRVCLALALTLTIEEWRLLKSTTCLDSQVL